MCETCVENGALRVDNGQEEEIDTMKHKVERGAVEVI